MAEATWVWTTGLVITALCLGAGSQTHAQSLLPNSPPARSIQIQSPRAGSLSGRLTDLHSAPLAGISIVLRNQASGAQIRAITTKNGAFRFASLDAGEYTLEADEPQLGLGHLSGIHVIGGIEARLQAAMRFEHVAPARVAAAAPDQMLAPVSAIPAQISAAAAPASVHATAPNQPLVATDPRAGISGSAITSSIAAESPRPVRVAAAPSAATIDLKAPMTSPAPPPLRPNIHLTYPPATLDLVTGERAALETQSVIAPSALALAIPRTLPLVAGFVPQPPIAAGAQRPDPATPVVATTVTAAQLQALPISGRRWQDFLVDTSAAGSNPDSSQAALSGSQESAEIAVDGANTRLVFGAASGSQLSGYQGQATDQQSSLNQAWNGGRGLGVSEAAVHELTTAAGNVEADGMGSAGGRTSISTESGANALHGQGFLFDRQNIWGAQNPFTKWLQNTGTASAPSFTALPFTPPDHESVWGLGMGGSIRRDQLFWFAALDSYHRNDPGLATVRNPMATNQYGDCAGFFCPPSEAQTELLSAQLTGPNSPESYAQAANDYLGVPRAGLAPSGLEQLAALLGPAPRSAAQWIGFARIDWRATERQHFTLESTGAESNGPGGGLTRVEENYGSHSFGSSQAGEQWLLGRWEAYLTPNLLAVTQGSVGRAILTARPATPSAFEKAFLNGNSYGQLPAIVVDSANGFTIGNPSRFGQGSYPDERFYHGQQMLDWARNRLLVKTDVELDHNDDATSLLRNQTGTYYYSHVANFISDALAFEEFGFADALDPYNPHNCGATNTTFGSQPCYSYYSQTMGPPNWHLSTNDWGSYISTQWQPARLAVFSAGLRWERQQMPPPIAMLSNPEIPLTESLPSPGNQWGPRVSLAVGAGKGPWPVLRFGYGMYYGRTENSTIETALTQTGSLRGDLSFFMRPSDDCQFCAGGSPPFPHVLAGPPPSVVKPGAVAFAPNFRNPEVHQAVAAIEQPLPGRTELTASAMLSLGRRLPISVDTNFDPTVNPGTITYSVKDPTGTGPIKSPQITVPFYATWPSATSPTGTAGRLNPDYQQISENMSRANSTYEAAMVRIVRDGRRGLSLHAHYTYAHAMDWNPGETPLDPADFGYEYGTSNLDVRHSAAVMAIFTTPWKLRHLAGSIGNGWMLSGIGQFRSGLPYTMRTSGSLPEEFTSSGIAIAGLGPGINGSSGDNRVYGVGRNTFRYPETWKADVRLAKRFNLGEMRQLEILAESFNLFNHQNVTELETTGYSIENSGISGTMPALCYLTINAGTGNPGCGTSSATGSPLIPAFGQPLNINGNDFYRERQIQLGLRMRF